MVESTHDVRIDGDRVLKSFRPSTRPGRGDEPDREWATLTLLHRWAPGLSPEPLRREDRDGVATIEMTRLAGESLGSTPLVPHQLSALATALHTLFTAVPQPRLATLPVRRWDPAEQVAELGDWIDEARPAAAPVVERALSAARAWLDSPEAAALVSAPPPADRVLGVCDGNIANVLWDGERCRLVDFEDAGLSDPACEVADLCEHVTVTLPELFAADDLVSLLGLRPDQLDRLVAMRRLYAVFWLLMLLPDGPAHRRNPPGSLERQSTRVLHLLRGPA